MDIEFKDINPKLKIYNYVIRDINDYFREKSKPQVVPHFQARLKDTRKLRKGYLYLLLNYYDENGHFQGFDESSLWTEIYKSESLSVSMPITIPDNTVRIEVAIEERKSKPSCEEAVGGLIFLALILTAGMLYLLK